MHWSIELFQAEFFSIEIKKPLPSSVHNIAQVKLKFRIQLQVLPQIRRSITFRVESSITRIYSNITDNIIKKVINV